MPRTLASICALFLIVCSPAFALDPQWNSPNSNPKESLVGEGAPVASEVVPKQPIPNQPVPGVPTNPGLINPKFKPRCEYRRGAYDCRHYADQYCRDFVPRRNCFAIVFCGFPGEPPCHAANLTRIQLPGGGYMYCVVEPQLNKIVEGTCWTTYNNTFEPDWFKDALCRAYQQLVPGITCPLPPLDPRILPDFPNHDPNHPLIIQPVPAKVSDMLRDDPLVPRSTTSAVSGKSSVTAE